MTSNNKIIKFSGAPIESDSPLLDSCLKGDQKAWEDFISKYGPVIQGAVHRIVGVRIRDNNPVDIEDITQDVFLRLVKDDYRLLHSYDSTKASLVTWLTIVARSTTLDYLRKKQLPTVPLDPDYHSQAVSDKIPINNPEIKIPLGLLSPRQRLVLQMFLEKDLEVTEISRILGIEEQTVRSTKHKALNKLRAFLKR